LCILVLTGAGWAIVELVNGVADPLDYAVQAFLRRPPRDPAHRCHSGAGLDGNRRGRTVTGHAHGRTGF